MRNAMAKKLFRWSQLLFDAVVGICDHSGKTPLGAAALRKLLAPFGLPGTTTEAFG